MKTIIIHKVNPAFKQVLENAGFDVETRLGLSREQVLEVLPQYDGLVVRSALKVDQEVLDAGTMLKFVGRLGAGMENIDAKYAASKNIQLFNAPEGNRSAVGEQAVGMLLSLFNNLTKADAEVRQGLWQREANRGEEIEGKTIAIIGYGNMGSAFAQKISGFGARVIAYDKYKIGFGSNIVEEVDLKTVFEEADIVSLHVPLQDDTHHMVNQEFIHSFRKNFFLINTARGPVVNTSELVKGLEKGKVRGACLDVLEFEGLSFEAISNHQNSASFTFLKEASNVILSPHIAGWTHQSDYKMALVLAKKIINHFQ